MTIESITGLRRWLLPAFLAGALATGGLATGGLAIAQDMGGHSMGAMQAEHEKMQAHLDKALAAAEATPDQAARIHQILGAAMQQLMPLHKQDADQHAYLHRLFTAPAIDRAEIERQRAQHVADFDQESRILATAFADAADVLTPAQRATLAAKMRAGH
jgi:Spy/CpxP family protein refolding chaperone